MDEIMVVYVTNIENELKNITDNVLQTYLAYKYLSVCKYPHSIWTNQGSPFFLYELPWLVYEIDDYFLIFCSSVNISDILDGKNSVLC